MKLLQRGIRIKNQVEKHLYETMLGGLFAVDRKNGIAPRKLFYTFIILVATLWVGTTYTFMSGVQGYPTAVMAIQFVSSGVLIALVFDILFIPRGADVFDGWKVIWLIIIIPPSLVLGLLLMLIEEAIPSLTE